MDIYKKNASSVTFVFSKKIIAVLVVLTALFFGFCYLALVVDSIGGGSWGGTDWVPVVIVGLLLLVPPLIFVASKTWRSSKSISITIKNILFALVVQFLPYAILFSISMFFHYQSVQRGKALEAANDQAIISRYTPTQTKLYVAPEHWNTYRGTSIFDGHLFPFVFSYPEEWSLRQQEGAPMYVGEREVIPLYIGNDAVKISASDRVIFSSDTTLNHELASSIDVPLNGYPIDRTVAELVTYQIDGVTVYRAWQDYTPLESRGALKFIKNEKVYTIHATIRSFSESEHIENVKTVKSVFDSLVFD